MRLSVNQCAALSSMPSPFSFCMSRVQSGSIIFITTVNFKGSQRSSISQNIGSITHRWLMKGLDGGWGLSCTGNTCQTYINLGSIFINKSGDFTSKFWLIQLIYFNLRWLSIGYGNLSQWPFLSEILLWITTRLLIHNLHSYSTSNNKNRCRRLQNYIFFFIYDIF